MKDEIAVEWYRKLERCAICGDIGFTEAEAQQAVVVGTGPTQFAHKRCWQLIQKHTENDFYLHYVSKE
jgi:hypothetical protein